MSKEKIVENLQDAFERRDQYVPKAKLTRLVEKNYDELKGWGYSEYSQFASDLCAEWGNFEELKRQYDLK